MHFEILVEGQSDLTALSSGIIQELLGDYGSPHTWKIHKHQGIGNFPDDPLGAPNPKNRTLLHNLPSKLRAYGKALENDSAVVVLIDLDDKDKQNLAQNFLLILDSCTPSPIARLTIAEEEMEAWFLGDRQAILDSYPEVQLQTLDRYQQDSICGTWEVLADAIYPGGLNNLQKSGSRSTLILEQKREWAKRISPNMRRIRNISPSYLQFCQVFEDIIT